MDLLDGVVALWQALQRGDEATGYRLYLPICAIVALQLQAGLDGFLAIEKHLLVQRGLFTSARRRQPYGWDLDTETGGRSGTLVRPVARGVSEVTNAVALELPQEATSMTMLHTPQTRCRVAVARADITPPLGIYHRMWGAADA